MIAILPTNTCSYCVACMDGKDCSRQSLCISTLHGGHSKGREQGCGSFAYRDVGKGREQGCGSFAYRDVGKGREQGCGSFAYRDVGKGREQGCGSFDQQSHQPDLFRGSLRILLACFISMFLPVTGWTGDSDLFRQLDQIANASLLMEDPNGHILHEQQIDQPLIPASTLKLLTAYAALKTWGPEHRFHTDFFLDNNNRLIVKGYGDPLLISEELDMITDELMHKGLKQINGIKTDSSFFSNSLNIDGQSATSNPYDASPGALASNFNTVFIKKSAQGIFSAEAQTPLTTLSVRLAQSLGNGKHRINLGKQEDGASYFAQLLQTKLQAKRVLVNGNISRTNQVDDLPIFYRHYNSRTLAENIQGMLEYSNNFIANQIFLLLGTATYGPPASMHKSRQALNAFIKREFNWTRHQIMEGAGLSRKNSMTAQQLVDVLNKLKPYAYLLPEQNARILAKTGTLQNVSSYAGYIKNSRGLSPFALIINHPVKPEFRLRLAETLANIHAQ